MRILVLTSIYPQPDDDIKFGVTNVVHSFAKEWAKGKHEVVVIHNHTAYPKLYSKLLNKKTGRINSKYGINFPVDYQNSFLESEKDGVKIFRMPMVKKIPRISYSMKAIRSRYYEIISLLESNNFKPDVIIGHWENPQIQLVSLLKDYFKAKASLVFHEIVYSKRRKYRMKVKEHLESIQNLGARSNTIAQQVQSLYDYPEKPFICYSGIPDKYFNLDYYPIKPFKNKRKNSYLFVGRLVETKNIHLSMNALALLNKKDNKFIFNIVGTGNIKNELIDLSISLNIKENVFFHDYLDRDKVLEYMNDSEVFIMVSENETFGLVYIEAMSRGCIVIANQDGGMNGIIEDGKNGFLAQGEDSETISRIINRINGMSTDEKEMISNEAIKTASKYKDSEMAKKYLDNIKY